MSLGVYGHEVDMHNYAHAHIAVEPEWLFLSVFKI